MCLIVFSSLEDIKNESEYSFILLANRDEYYDRPTKSIHWWKEGYLAGKDLKAGGTWLGVSEDGRFAAVTNYREDPTVRESSRGDLVKNFLENQILAEDYLQTLNKQDYAGFNLLLRDSSGVHYLSNRGGDGTQINNGVNALGNRILNSPTNKVKNVSDSFKELLHCNFTKEDLFKFMRKEEGDLTKVGMDEFIQTEDQELPFRFIKSEFYGTRCTTVYLINKNGSHHVLEQEYKKEGELGEIRSFEFRPAEITS